MRLIFMGTAEFAVPSLRNLIRAGHDIPLVVTQPDRPAGREKGLHRLRSRYWLTSMSWSFANRNQLEPKTFTRRFKVLSQRLL